jgi:hypothetical protein
MVNWRMWQPPRRGRLKKGAPSEPPKRYPPGNRNALRPSSRPGSEFRRLRDGGTAAGSAVGGVRPATAAECRHQRSCRSRNFPQMRDVHLPQSRAHALPKVSRPGPMHIHRRCRGWLQGSDRNSTQTVACTGPSMAQTPSSPCAAADSVDAVRTSGSAALRGMLPESIPQTRRAPYEGG